MLRNALKGALAKRGAVYLIHEVDFGGDVMPKFCVLLEENREGANSLIVAFTTSRLEFLKYPTAVKIPDGTINDISGDSCLQCENWREIEIQVIVAGSASKHLGQLPDGIVEKIDDALEHVEAPDDIFIRMLRID